jgi:lipopolysaccharide export system permease protein
MGNIVFIGIMLMFQGLRLAEFTLIHGLGSRTLGEILVYMVISILPALLPMSLLFSVLMTYSRMSSESEVVAFKASGLSPYTILLPGLCLGIIISILTSQLTFELAPWGNRQFEVLMSKFTNTKAGIALREGTFMEGFFDMVVYANKITPETGTLSKIFIFDERQTPPLTIIAKKGIMQQKNDFTGNEVKLTLENGDIHRKTATHTKIEFEKFFITLNENYNLQIKDKTMASMTLKEINAKNTAPETQPPEKRKFEIEFHKRWILTVLPFLMSFLGAVFGFTTNHRGSKGSGFVVCIGLIVAYWILFVIAESSAAQAKIPVAYVMWFPNLFFLLVGLFAFHRKESFR